MNLFRIHEIARELNSTSPEILKICRKLGYDAKNHSSAVDQNQKNKIVEYFNDLEKNKIKISISDDVEDIKAFGKKPDKILDKLKGKRLVFIEDSQQETGPSQAVEPEPVKPKKAAASKKPEKAEKPVKAEKAKVPKTVPDVKTAVETALPSDTGTPAVIKKPADAAVISGSAAAAKEVKPPAEQEILHAEKVLDKAEEPSVSKPLEVKDNAPSVTEEIAPAETGAVHFEDEDEDKSGKKPKPKGKPQESYKARSSWDEEKRINIRMVLDKELDKEEREGKFKPRVKTVPVKKTEAGEKQGGLKAVKKTEIKTAVHKETEIKRPEIKKVIELPESLTIKQLSEKIGIASEAIIQKLFNMGEIYTINQPIDKDIVEILAHEFSFKYKIIDFDEEIDLDYHDSEKDLVPKPPIVTVMGHVDHGKTTLLDAIRKSDVALGEAGGITQSIGAYQTEYNGKKITFIDTPGHEAFTTMRARGAKVTDIAVIVVAADDGIMPQTAEAINHAKDAKVPIIVAVNKIDLQDANPDKVKQGMTEYGLVPEEWGGDTIFVSISAKNRQNISDLLEMVLLVAEMNDIKGNPNAEGSGIIVESKLDKNLGPVGTVIIKRGKISTGDYFVTGNSFGRIRTIRNEKSELLDKAELSQPVEISGFNIVPQAGDKFYIVKNEKIAKEIITKREDQKKLAKSAETKKHITLEDLAEIAKGSEIKRLKVILKSESNGSLDAVEKAIKDAEEELIKIDFIHGAVGAITDSDILLASASDAIVIGFGVVATSGARALAKEENVEIRTYNIIYKLVDDIKLALKGMLEPVIEEKIKGNVEVREVFKLSKTGTVAGCYILDGEIERGNQVRIIRDGRIIYDGKIDSLHRFKEDVKKVGAGYECGIRIENYQDLNKGDTLEVYEKKAVS